jgi:hypothetical protein
VADNKQRIAELKKDLDKELKKPQWGFKGDPEALRDHRERIESLRTQIRSLGG